MTNNVKINLFVVVYLGLVYWYLQFLIHED